MGECSKPAGPYPYSADCYKLYLNSSTTKIGIKNIFLSTNMFIVHFKHEGYCRKNKHPIAPNGKISEFGNIGEGLGLFI